MNSIKQDISKYRNESQLPDRVKFRIATKLRTLADRYNIRFDSTVLSIAKNPALPFQQGSSEAIANFFHRPIDIWLEEGEEREFIFSKAENDWIPAAKRPFSIAIFNLNSGRAESWSRLNSDSKWRNDHFQNGGSPKKSRFNGDLKFIKPLEFLTFNDGIGILKSSGTLWMYLRFTKPIGISAKGDDLTAMCVQCSRVRRSQNSKARNANSKYGYKVNLHGYPISISEITKAFSGMKIMADSVPEYDNNDG
jgi:hypothetical protein